MDFPTTGRRVMARKRLIAPQFFTHAGLFRAEQQSGLPCRLAFAGLWTVADRRGLFEWKPLELKLAVLPYDNADMADTMSALCRHGFLKVFEHPDHPGRLFCAITSFGRWQTFNLREKANLYIPQPLSEQHLTDTVPEQYKNGYDMPGTGTGTGTGTKYLAPRKQPRGGATKPETSWLAPIAAAHEKIYGKRSFTPALAGRFAKAWRGHVEEHGAEKCAEVWTFAHTTGTDEQRDMRSPEFVASKFGRFDPQAIVDGDR